MERNAALEEAAELVTRGLNAIANAESTISDIAKRINIPINSSSTPDQIVASTQDPWSKSGKYALGWVYFALILLVATTAVRCYHVWGDKIRIAVHKEEAEKMAPTPALHQRYPGVYYDHEMVSAATDASTRHFFPNEMPVPEPPKDDATMSTMTPIKIVIALFRWIFYRPMPVIKLWKLELVFPSLSILVIVTLAVSFVMLYCFLPQPLFYQSIRDGSPPVAIRAGMLSVSIIPWIVGLSTKANIITMLTGIGHERLNVLHRWGGYICLLLAIVHVVPFYITPVWTDGALPYFIVLKYPHMYIYGTGLAALVPLAFLCLHSLPVLRAWMYELFVALHAPVAVIFIAMMFWHCKNYLTSWAYLEATLVIWVITYIGRVFFLNWTVPWRMSWLIGEESAVTILPENAVKVTIPTQMKWRPGQYAYLRMPGISVFESHPFTIASLCSDDFPSEYGEQYRDMALVFRPFGGFTRKVLDTAIEKGPYKTYRAFIDGPYGGMQRELASFDTVIFFAGGSGITAIASQLLDLIKRMRDGKAVTRSVRVIWSLKRLETMEWFKEELRICREFAPPGSVHCSFFITAVKRFQATNTVEKSRAPRPTSMLFHDRLNDVFQGVASKRNSAYIRDEAAGDIAKEMELRRENEDSISALPQAYVAPHRDFSAPPPPQSQYSYIHPQPPSHYFDPTASATSFSPIPDPRLDPIHASQAQQPGFDFGFPSTPTNIQKNLMRFAFLPTQRRDGWRSEYGRPDIPYMLKELSRDFGRRTCVYVCGPPAMRVDVAKTVAGLQSKVLFERDIDEIFLHAENYAI